MTLRVRTLASEELLANLEALAQLRMRVFRAFPYLYEGDAAYEADYVRDFASERNSALVCVFDDDAIVGAATASPMLSQKAEFRDPFRRAGLDVDRLFYFGESVLLPEYRGLGFGHAFFDRRERVAKEFGANAACFAAVIRGGSHPSRPADYRPLDAFWKGRGYSPVSGLVSQLAWKEIGESEETVKTMQYWMRRW